MYASTMEKKVISIDDRTKELLEFYDQALENLTARTGADNPILNTGEAKPKNGSWWNVGLRQIEKAFDKNIGATERELPIQLNYLDPIAQSLWIEYRRFLSELIIRHKKTEAFELTEKKKIASSTILLREILLRFALESLDVHNEDARDGLEVIKAMNVFLREVKKSNIFIEGNHFKGFAEDVFTCHRPWVNLFEKIIKTVKTMNLIKDTFAEAVKHIEALKKIIIFRIIAELVKSTEDISHEGELSDTYLEYTLHAYELRMRFMLTDKGSLNGESGFSVYNATRLSELQEKIVQYVKGKSSDSKLNDLYNKLLEVNRLNLILDKIGNIVSALGWYPFLTGVIKLKSYSEKLTKCTQYSRDLSLEIEDLIADPQFSKKYPKFKMAFIRNDISNFTLSSDQFEISAALNDLNNPELLRRIGQFYKADFEMLDQLSKESGCDIIDYAALGQFQPSLPPKLPKPLPAPPGAISNNPNIKLTSSISSQQLFLSEPKNKNFKTSPEFIFLIQMKSAVNEWQPASYYGSSASIPPGIRSLKMLLDNVDNISENAMENKFIDLIKTLKKVIDRPDKQDQGITLYEQYYGDIEYMFPQIFEKFKTLTPS